MQRIQISKVGTIRRIGEVYDVLDLKLLLLDLNKRGYELDVSSVDAKQLQVTCRKTRNSFVIQHIGHVE